PASPKPASHRLTLDVSGAATRDLKRNKFRAPKIIGLPDHLDSSSSHSGFSVGRRAKDCCSFGRADVLSGHEPFPNVSQRFGKDKERIAIFVLPESLGFRSGFHIELAAV